ncbi:hypothetical protein [Paenibacillus sinopodophylli]|uniref:hypothetical protein n=1 Tax=Paenibacillus sinopodophylli TaxID=1837342 RepID=UPI00110C9A6C|nr:hypothetical protein [Paenibacillus sinopodophylli]
MSDQQDQHYLNVLEKENEHLKDLMFKHLQEIADLRNEVRYLKQEMDSRQVGEQEKRLVLLANSIIEKLDPRGEV